MTEMLTETLVEVPARSAPEAPTLRATPRRRARGIIDHPLIELTLVRFREFYREPEAVFWVLLFPILLAAGLGIAFKNRPSETARVAIVSGVSGSQALADALARSPGLSVQLADDTTALRALSVGRVAVLVTLRGEGTVEYRYDRNRPESRSARLLVDDALQRAAGRRDALEANERYVEERGARYIDFVIPGLLGMSLMGSGIWGMVFPIVDARRKKLLKRLVATPMRRAEYLTSFLFIRLTLLLVEVVALLGFGALVFGVPVRGPLWQLGVVTLISSLMFASLGLLLVSRVRTMLAASGLMNLVMLPMWILSGVFFSASRFPEVVQPAIQLLPLTAVIDAFRATMLEGAGLAAIATETAIIAAWLVASFVLGLRLFRWQ